VPALKEAIDRLEKENKRLRNQEPKVVEKNRRKAYLH